MNYKEERKMLEEFGCKEIEYESLVNNYFISFTYKGKKYTIKHILNVYGAEVDLWELYLPGRKTECFSTLESLLDCI